MAAKSHMYTMDEILTNIEAGGPPLLDDAWFESRGLPEWTDEEIAEDRRRRMRPVKPFAFQHWTFDVLDGGKWYRIDAAHPVSELYVGVPESVQRRAREAILAAIDAAIDTENGIGDAPTTIVSDCDHTDEYEAILRTVFDDVRFVETDYIHGLLD